MWSFHGQTESRGALYLSIYRTTLTPECLAWVGWHLSPQWFTQAALALDWLFPVIFFSDAILLKDCQLVISLLQSTHLNLPDKYFPTPTPRSIFHKTPELPIPTLQPPQVCSIHTLNWWEWPEASTNYTLLQKQWLMDVGSTSPLFIDKVYL